MYQIECKLAKLFNNHFEQREQIVTGKYDPTAEEATWKFDADVKAPAIIDPDQRCVICYF